MRLREYGTIPGKTRAAGDSGMNCPDSLGVCWKSSSRCWISSEKHGTQDSMETPDRGRQRTGKSD
jgi:hypothetical protein